MAAKRPETPPLTIARPFVLCSQPEKRLGMPASGRKSQGCHPKIRFLPLWRAPGRSIGPEMKFLPPDKMVQNLQLAVYGPDCFGLPDADRLSGAGTIWYMLTGSIGHSTIQVIVIALATIEIHRYLPSRRPLPFDLERLSSSPSSDSSSKGALSFDHFASPTAPSSSAVWSWSMRSSSSCTSSGNGVLL